MGGIDTRAHRLPGYGIAIRDASWPTPPLAPWSYLIKEGGVVKVYAPDGTKTPVGGGSTAPLLGISRSGSPDESPLINATMAAVAANPSYSGIQLLGPQWPIRQTVGWPVDTLGKRLVGGGRWATQLIIDDSQGSVGAGIKYTKTYRCTVESMTVTAPSPRAASAGAGFQQAGGTLTHPLIHAGLASCFGELIDVDFDNMNSCVILNDGPAGEALFGFMIKGGGDWRAGNGGDGVRIDCNNGADVGVGGAMLFISTAIGAGAHRAGINMHACGDVNVDMVSTYGGQYGYLCDTPMSNSYDWLQNITNSEFDSATINAVRLASLSSRHAARFTNTWFASTLGGHNFYALKFSGNVTLTGCESANAGAAGYYGFLFDAGAEGGGVIHNVKAQGCWGGGGNMTSLFGLTGVVGAHLAGNSVAPFEGFSATYGLAMFSGTDYVARVGNDWHLATTALGVGTGVLGTAAHTVIQDL